MAAPKSLSRRKPTLPQPPASPFRLGVGKLPRFAPGDGNPAWGTALVTREAILQIVDDKGFDDKNRHLAPRDEGAFTVSARPHVSIHGFEGFPESVKNTPDSRRNPEREQGRVRVAISEGGHVVGKKLPGDDFSLEVAFYSTMCGWQTASGPVTLEQLLSFEESVRAAIEAARQTGMLPIASKYRRQA